MLKVGIFPDLLKISKVVPVYKKDANTNLSNYRPISLLLSMSKIFERVILEQLFTYLDDNNLIHRHQYGFRKHHSTEYAALHIVDYVYYKLDLKKITINLYLDLSKGFDSLLHEILLKNCNITASVVPRLILWQVILKNENSLFNLKATSQI